MQKKEVKAQKAIGPYSQGIQFGNLIFVSGQIGINPRTNELPEGIEAQTKQALENLKKILEAAGSSLEKVLKTTVYLTNMEDFPLMNEVYATYFSPPYPARATVGVAKLPKGALIEIECLAYQEESKDNSCNCKYRC